jgi:hypothetical protein
MKWHAQGLSEGQLWAFFRFPSTRMPLSGGILNPRGFAGHHFNIWVKAQGAEGGSAALGKHG